MAQLVEQSLLIPEIRGSHPLIGKNLYILKICFLSTVYLKDENKEKDAGNGPFLKKICFAKMGNSSSTEKRRRILAKEIFCMGRSREQSFLKPSIKKDFASERAFYLIKTQSFITLLNCR